MASSTDNSFFVSYIYECGSPQTPHPAILELLHFLSSESSRMNRYELHCTLRSPRESVNFMAFSPSGRFLIVGDGEPPRLRVFDRQVGFQLTIEKDVASSPTSLTFETPTSFLAGLEDGRFVEYRIDLASNRLVKGWTNNMLRGISHITAIALDETSKILALAAGPSVFVFSRIPETGEVLGSSFNITTHVLPRQIPVCG